MINSQQIINPNQQQPVIIPSGERFAIDYTKKSDPFKSRYCRMVFLLIISVIVAGVSILWVSYLWIKSNEIKSQFKAESLIDVGRSIIDDLKIPSISSVSTYKDQNAMGVSHFDLKSLVNIAKDAVQKFNETIHSAARDTR